MGDSVFRLLVESVTNYAILVLDPDGYVRSWNRGAELLKGYTASEIIGEHFSVFYTAEAQALGYADRELQLARSTGRHHEEGWRVRKDGSRFWASVTITALVAESGELVGFGKVTHDLTERKQLDEQRESYLVLLQSTSCSDELTGLANRRGMADALKREMARSTRTGDSLVVAVVDLDGFKSLNDTRGHQAGDLLLRQASRAWQGALRGSDLLCRSGGDEFAIIMPACSHDEAGQAIARLRDASPETQFSSGIASWDGTETAAALLSRADEALYVAKREGH